MSFLEQEHADRRRQKEFSNITQQLHQDRQQFEEAVRQNKELEQENARISAELAALKEKYKTATEAEKQEINREVKRNEDAFTAVQWNDKGVEMCSQKDYQGAIGCFRKAIELEINPNHESAKNNLEFALENM